MKTIALSTVAVLALAGCSGTPDSNMTLAPEPGVTVELAATSITITGRPSPRLLQLSARELLEEYAPGEPVPADLENLVTQDAGGTAEAAAMVASSGTNYCDTDFTQLYKCLPGNPTGEWCPGILSYGYEADSRVKVHSFEAAVCTLSGKDTQLDVSYGYGIPEAPLWATTYTCNAKAGELCYRREVDAPGTPELSLRRWKAAVLPRISSTVPVTSYRSMVRWF